MINDKEIRDDILRSPVFRSLPADKIDEIVRNVRNETLPPRAIVFRQGDAAENFYIISSGKVRAFVRHENRIERDLAIRGAGDYFGEIALLTGESRTATIEVLEKTELIVFSKELFDNIVKEHPEISRTFLKEMRSWLLKDEEIIKEEAAAVMKASRMTWVDFIFIVGVSVLLALSFNHTNPNGIPLFPSPPDANSIPVVSASAAMQDYSQGKVLILDAMPPNFYQKRHIKGAVNMPMTLFDIVYLMNFSEEDRDRTILVYGNSISRPYDLEIASKLMLRGYEDVKIIDGGLPAWEAKGYPVEETAAK
jgi:rhodanese-related sulfurtransferase